MLIFVQYLFSSIIFLNIVKVNINFFFKKTYLKIFLFVFLTLFFTYLLHPVYWKNPFLFIEAINNHNLENIVENQKNAMTSILKNKKIPYISIEIKKRNEETLGELFSYFILETILMGQNLKINPFNQPAVEEIKELTRQNLFKKNQK